jgi:hypothetical protein
MKPIKSFLVLAIVLLPALASAQGYYGNGGGAGYRERGGFHHRMGRLAYGGSIGVGGMSDNGGMLSCDNCGNYNPLAVEADFHIGGFITPRFALLFEGQVNGQTVSLDNSGNGNVYAVQSAAMIAGQYWLLPMVWVKGGIGFANLSYQDDAGGSTPGINGLALMGAVGLELLSTRFLALDLQGRLIEGTYDGTNDHITSGTVGLGLNWY